MKKNAPDPKVFFAPSESEPYGQCTKKDRLLKLNPSLLARWQRNEVLFANQESKNAQTNVPIFIHFLSTFFHKFVVAPVVAGNKRPLAQKIVFKAIEEIISWEIVAPKNFFCMRKIPR